MEFTEEKIFEAFGIDKDAGEKGQEVADPDTQEAAAPTSEGVKEQEVADPAEAPGNTGTADGDATPADDADGAEAEDKPDDKQTAEQRKANAAKRRQQEQQAAIDAAVQKAVQDATAGNQAAMADIFKRAGLKNTFTGQPITTIDEFNAWDKSYRESKIQQDLKAGKLTQETLDQMIDQNPAVRRASEIIKQQDTAAQARQAAEAQAQIDRQIAEIGKLNPSIKSVQDLLSMERHDVFYDYVRKGNDFLDAYYLTFRDKMDTRTAEAAKQQALNNARGKDHLRGTGNARGSGAASVPRDDMEMFRLFNPTATEAQIAAYYNTHRNGGK